MSRAEQFIKRTGETVELELPSGCKALVRRPPLLAWAMAGTIPPFFNADVRAAWARVRETGGVESLDDLNPAEFEDTLKIVRALAGWAFVDPKLQEGATGEDGAIDPSYLDDKDWTFLAQWLMAGSPGVPVETTSGVMTAEAVRSFRDGEQGAVALHPEPDRGEIRTAAE
jgi:hypothetical protein